MSMFILYLTIYLIELAMAVWYFDRLYKSRYSTVKKLCICFAGYMILFAISFLDIVSVNVASFMIMNLILIILLYEAKLVYAVFNACIMTGVMFLTEIMSLGILQMFSKGFAISEMYILKLMILVMISKPLYFVGLVLIAVLAKGRNRKTAQVDIYMIFLTVIPLASCVIMVLLFEMGFAVNVSKYVERLIILSATGLFVMNICMYFIYIMSQKKNERLLETGLELQKEQDELKFYKTQIEQDENQKLLIHDIRKHISTIDGFIKNNNIKEAENYIEQLYNIPELRETINFSKNNALNLALNRYVIMFLDRHIDFHVDVSNTDIEHMSPMDITALISNMLDNAYEAALKVSEPVVDLRIHGSTFVLVNSCEGDTQVIVEGQIESTKKDGKYHGYGLKSIKRIVKKYGGELEFYIDKAENEFHIIASVK